MSITRHDRRHSFEAVEHATPLPGGHLGERPEQGRQVRLRRSSTDRPPAAMRSNKSKVMQCHIWVTDIRNRAPMNEVWTEWVDPKNLPARACVEAKLADPKALVEIMVIAGK